MILVIVVGLFEHGKLPDYFVENADILTQGLRLHEVFSFFEQVQSNHLALDVRGLLSEVVEVVNQNRQQELQGKTVAHVGVQSFLLDCQLRLDQPLEKANLIPQHIRFQEAIEGGRLLDNELEQI